MAFIDLMAGREVNFIPQQAEDYCFARAFGLMNRKDGEARWPKLHGHESDRLEEMEIMIEKARQGIEEKFKQKPMDISTNSK